MSRQNLPRRDLSPNKIEKVIVSEQFSIRNFAEKYYRWRIVPQENYLGGSVPEKFIQGKFRRRNLSRENCTDRFYQGGIVPKGSLKEYFELFCPFKGEKKLYRLTCAPSPLPVQWELQSTSVLTKTNIFQNKFKLTKSWKTPLQACPQCQFASLCYFLSTSGFADPNEIW